MIGISLDTKSFELDIDRFLRRNDQDFKTAVADSTSKVHKMARMKVRGYTRGSKVLSGTLIGGIEQTITNKGYTGEVISRAAHSRAFEEGTRPHHVRVKTKKVLAGPYRGRPAGWKVSASSKAMGYATYGKKVQHPGTPPKPFMMPAFKFGQGNLEKMIRRSLN